MTDERPDRDLRDLLESYNRPPPYPGEEIEHRVLAASRIPRSRVRLRTPAAIAAAIALFLMGMAAGWSMDGGGSAMDPAPISTTPILSEEEPGPDAYHVVWF